MLTANPKIHSHVFPTGLGWMALAWSESCLLRLTFGHPSAAAAIAYLEEDGGWASTQSDELPDWVADLVARLQSYAAGRDESFDDVPLDFSHLTDFQRRIVRACRRIRPGRVKSYGELAAAAGSVGAARAVGNVMAKNRYPIIVPCHRVVGSAGNLGGFSAPDGLSTKRRMLALEGYETGQPRKTRNARKGMQRTR